MCLENTLKWNDLYCQRCDQLGNGRKCILEIMHEEERSLADLTADLHHRILMLPFRPILDSGTESVQD